MGDMADYYSAHHELFVCSEDVWTTEDGRKLTAKDFTDLHLKNTIAYLKKKYGRMPSKWRWIQEEYDLRAAIANGWSGEGCDGGGQS